MVHLYLEEDADAGTARQRLLDAWRGRFGDRIWAFTREEAMAAGLFGPVRPEVGRRVGDVMIAARDALAFYDTRRVRPTAMEVVGQHGSLTKAEREVPLLCFQAAGKTRRPPGSPWLSSSFSPAPWTAESRPLRCRWTTTTAPADAAGCGSAATTAPAAPVSPAASGWRRTPSRWWTPRISGTKWCSAAPGGSASTTSSATKPSSIRPAQVEQLARVVDEIDVDVFAFGITADFRTRLFPGSQRLIELADRVQVLQVEALCWCGRRATHNARTVDGVMVMEGAQVVVGDVDMAGDVRPVPRQARPHAGRGLRNAVPAPLHAPRHRPWRQHHGPAGPVASVRS